MWRFAGPRIIETWVGVVAVAIGLAASIAGTSADAVALDLADRADMIAQLRDHGSAPVAGYAEYTFWEENTQLPSGTYSRTRSFAEMQFFAENTWLPTGGERLALLAPGYRSQTGDVNL
jgi:hypothetical protein